MSVDSLRQLRDAIEQAFPDGPAEQAQVDAIRETWFTHRANVVQDQARIADLETRERALREQLRVTLRQLEQAEHELRSRA